MLLVVLASLSTIMLHERAIAQPVNMVTDVTIGQDLYDTLNTAYLESTDEFVYCLYADVDGSVVHITSMYPAHVHTADVEHVRFGMCSPFADGHDPTIIERIMLFYTPREQQGQDVYIGTIHNHPNLYRLLSLQDSYTFGMIGDMCMGIISGQNQMYMYAPHDFIDGIKLSVI